MSLENVQILAPLSDKPEHPSGTSQADILTKSALSFVVLLHRSFNGTRKELLQNRKENQAKVHSGQPLAFSKDPTLQKALLDPTWRGAIPGLGLADRRTEITGPPERKMVVNALNTAVKTYMADFEDSSTPTWQNVINGQVNLYDAARKKIDFTIEETGKSYKVNRAPGRQVPTVLVRPRGWHMTENHVLVDGEPILASIFDFGLYFFHNARLLISNGVGPYFYLPKMEHHLEAKLWNDIFNVSQDYLRLPRGTIRATVLIETLPAAYQMEEIIWQLRDHSAGLNCGRWDYIFSALKTFIADSNKILPDRAQVTMTAPFMRAYCERLINICHRRQVHAMGGMAAQIPIKNDPEANEQAFEKVRQDKLREATMGHDGTWVAHPALAPVANDIFNDKMPLPNQIHVIPEEHVSEEDLSNVSIAGGQITLAGIRGNLFSALCYMELWLRGQGCVPINNLMEDAATAEVSRLQLYQWVKHLARLDTGEKITADLTSKMLSEETEKLASASGPENKFALAAKYLRPEVCGERLSDFLTTLIYDEVTSVGLPLDVSLLKA